MRTVLYYLALDRRWCLLIFAVQIWIAVLLAVYGGALLVGSCEWSRVQESSYEDFLTLDEVVFGWVGDRLSRRHALFFFGLVMLLIATVILSIGRHIAVLVVGRLLQGLSAAVVWTSGLALLTDIFGQERYGEAVGYAQASVSIGTTSAPLLGGIVYAQGGYSAVSAMSLGTVALSIVLALVMVEPKRNSGWEDSSARFLATNSDNTTPASEESGGVGRNTESPIANEPGSGLPDERSFLIKKNNEKSAVSNRPAYLFMLRSGRILAAMGGIFTFAFVIISFEGMIPLFVKETFHWDSTRAALTFLSWIIPGFLGPVAGKAADRLGPRWIATGGFLFTVPPLILMRYITEDSNSQKFLLCSLLSLIGEWSFIFVSCYHGGA